MYIQLLAQQGIIYFSFDLSDLSFVSLFYIIFVFILYNFFIKKLRKYIFFVISYAYIKLYVKWLTNADKFNVIK